MGIESLFELRIENDSGSELLVGCYSGIVDMLRDDTRDHSTPQLHTRRFDIGNPHMV